jgi:replicative DNA helicase
MTDTERQELQRKIIGSILAFPESFAKFIRALSVDNFAGEFSRQTMAAIHRCHEDGHAINPANVAAIGKLSEADLTGLQISGGADLGLLVKLLAECSVRDRCMKFKDSITEEADPFELLEGLKKLDNETAAIIGANKEPDKQQILEDYIEFLQTNATKGVQRIPTGLPTLDRMLTGGLAPGNISFIGGTPGSGKTSFMLSLALNAAKAGTSVAFLEGEMTTDEILERLNGIETGESIDLIREGKDYKRLSQKFISDFFKLPFDVLVDRERSIEGLVSQIKQRVHAGVRLIFVDYLQVYAPKGKAEDEYSQIKKVSETLRKIALQNQVHLCVASSLNRNEQGQSRLSLNSLYGSSQLGHDCAVALLLTGEQNDLAELQARERTVTLSVVKNRSGPRGDITLRFLLGSQRMEELTRRPEPAAVGFSNNGEDNAF